MPVLSMCRQRRFTYCEEESLTTSHAHDVLSGFVDLVLRLGVSTGGLGVSFALLLSSVCTKMTRRKR